MAVGAENMSNTPVVLNGHRWGRGLAPVTMVDHLNPIQYNGFGILAKDAGEVALEHGITREMQDQWALGSQQKYQLAKKAGKFADEVVPVEVPQKKGPAKIFTEDDFPRADSTIEGLSKLKPVYGSPTVTAGNAPGLDAGSIGSNHHEKIPCRFDGCKTFGYHSFHGEHGQGTQKNGGSAGLRHSSCLSTGRSHHGQRGCLRNQ